MPRVYGVSFSPYVRKVHVALREKGIAFDIDQTLPGDESQEYRALSPLGRVPAYRDGDFTACDSSIICAYIEKRHPTPALYPSDPEDYARALWIEEFCDTDLRSQASVIFVNRVVKPLRYKQPCDEDEIAKALTIGLPPLFGYLEQQLADNEWFVGDHMTIADITAASICGSMYYCGEKVPEDQFPNFAAFIKRMWSRPAFKEAKLIDLALIDLAISGVDIAN